MNVSENEVRIYRCMIDIIVPRRHRQVLIDAMRRAPFALRHHVEIEAIEKSIRNGRLRIQYLRPEPWVGFESDIGLLSYSLDEQPVRGISVIEHHRHAASQTIIAEKIVGRRGETVRIPLLPEILEDGVRVDAEREDLEAVRRFWDSYPSWTQEAFRAKHPTLRSW